jgi:mono/diheme cytochrome c family protein
MSQGKSGVSRRRAKQPHSRPNSHWSSRDNWLRLAAVLSILAVPGYLQVARSQQAAPAAALVTSAAAERALLDQYCVGCHNQRLKTAGLSLDQLDVARMHDRAEVWEMVVRKLRAGMMPPSGLPRPSSPVLESMITFMEKELDRGATANLTPPGLHRLHQCDS